MRPMWSCCMCHNTLTFSLGLEDLLSISLTWLTAGLSSLRRGECLMWRLTHPKVNDQKKRVCAKWPRRKLQCCSWPVSEETRHHFCHLLQLTQTKSDKVWEGTTQGHEGIHRRHRLSGPPWRLITTVLVVKKTALSNEGNLRSCVCVWIVVLSSYTGTIYKDVCKEKKDHKGIKTTLEAETVITPYTQGPRGGRGCWNFEGERIMDSRPTLREADVRRHGQPCAWTCRELTATTFL